MGVKNTRRIKDKGHSKDHHVNESKQSFILNFKQYSEREKESERDGARDSNDRFSVSLGTIDF